MTCQCGEIRELIDVQSDPRFRYFVCACRRMAGTVIREDWDHSAATNTVLHDARLANLERSFRQKHGTAPEALTRHDL